MANSIQKAVVLGATSGIAQPLLRKMAQAGNELLLIGRSQERLDALKPDLLARGAAQVLTFEADLVESDPHLVVSFAKECFPDFDTVILAYGSMRNQESCQTSADHAVLELQTNFLSPAALLTGFAKYFEARKAGTLAVITSVAGDRGRRSNYVYGAAKGGLSLFLQGLRSRLHASGVRVLTIKPGPVDTAMTAGIKGAPFLATPEKVAADIYRALLNPRKDVIYTPRRWRWIMAALSIIPERLFKRLAV
jgi:hypothetical protein